MPRARVVSRTMKCTVFDVMCVHIESTRMKNVEVYLPIALASHIHNVSQFDKYVPSGYHPLKYRKIDDEMITFEMPEKQYLAEARVVHRVKTQ